MYKIQKKIRNDKKDHKNVFSVAHNDGTSSVGKSSVHGMGPQSAPIYCEGCESLALAHILGRNMCAQCLSNMVSLFSINSVPMVTPLNMSPFVKNRHLITEEESSR